MSIVKVVLNMSKLSVPAKINRAKFVVAELTGNPSYATPTPTLASVTAAINALETAWVNAEDGGKAKTALMHDAEAALMVLMTKLMHYIEDNSAGLPANVHSSGLTLRTFTGQTVPTNTYWVKNGKEIGEIVVKIKAHPRSTYRWQYSVDPIGPTTWVDYMSTRSRVYIKNLTVGLKYWIRVCYMDKNGEHAFTNPISVIVV
jgi:hypothetical protein